MKLSGRIIKGVGGLYFVETSDGVKISKPRGIFRKTNFSPVVGDYCEITSGDSNFKDDDAIFNIEAISERKNELARPRVVNIDVAAVVSAADNLNTYTLDKYLIILEKQAAGNKFGIIAVINKTDLADEEKLNTYKNIYGGAGYPVFFLSAANKTGGGAFVSFIKGGTAVLAGQSGAGKSSIANMLCGKRVMEVGELSKKILRGRHTTRHAEMFSFGGGYIVDTPGFASLKTDIARGELKNYFREFKRFEEVCRFGDCRHIDEPDCAVKENLGGAINAERYGNYVKIYNELS